MLGYHNLCWSKPFAYIQHGDSVLPKSDAWSTSDGCTCFNVLINLYFSYIYRYVKYGSCAHAPCSTGYLVIISVLWLIK